MTLQIIWFALIFILLIGYAVLDGFDLGVGFWHPFAKKKEHRDAFIESIGPFWDGNEVWLLTGGGAIFAAFPPVYATTFSGFYFAMILVILSLIFRACSIEFRGIITSDSWIRKWDIAFFLGSSVPALLYGVAVGNVVRGIPMDAAGNYTGNFFGLLNGYSLFIGITTLLMFALHGAIFINLKTTGELQEQSKGWVKKTLPIYFVVLFVALMWTFFSKDHSSVVASSIVAVLSLATVLMIPSFIKSGRELAAFIVSSVGITLNMVFVAASIFPFWVPARGGINSGLTIYNSSSSQLTLTVMLIMTVIGMPFVVGYTVYIYKTFAGKVTT